MKCLFAIPALLESDARQKAATYVRALARLSEDVVDLADDINAYCESLAAASQRMEQDDWEQAKRALNTAGSLAGQLFWSQDEVRQARDVLAGAESRDEPAIAQLAVWLDAQAKRKRAIVLLTR